MTDDRREWYIYVLRDPRDNAVRYVGFTTDVGKRFYSHIYNANAGIKSHKNSWIRSLLLLNLQPVIEVIERGAGEWQSVEQYWVRHYRMQGARLTNMTDGGEGLVGMIVSQETIEKRRQSHLGSKRSPETRERMRQAQLGRKKSPEHREKLSQANLGRKQSPEAIENMRETQTRNHGIPVRRVEDGMIFASLSDAARSVDGKYQSIARAIKHGTTCAGYHWERVGETPPADPYTLDGNALMMRID